MVVLLPEWANIELRVIEDLPEQELEIEFNVAPYELNFIISVDYYSQPIDEEIMNTIRKMIANQIEIRERINRVRSYA